MNAFILPGLFVMFLLFTGVMGWLIYNEKPPEKPKEPPKRRR